MWTRHGPCLLEAVDDYYIPGNQLVFEVSQIGEQEPFPEGNIHRMYLRNMHSTTPVTLNLLGLLNKYFTLIVV
jgi:hypothetical protein